MDTRQSCASYAVANRVPDESYGAVGTAATRGRLSPTNLEFMAPRVVLTRTEDSVALVVRPSNDVPHLLEQDLLHQDEHRRHLIREPEG